MTAQVSKIVENDFRKRLERVLYLIESYGIRYSEIGVFGSYARNDYVAASDIDLCIITDYRPGLLQYFSHPSRFFLNRKKDGFLHQICVR